LIALGWLGAAAAPRPVQVLPPWSGDLSDIRYYLRSDRPALWTLAEPLPVIGPPHWFFLPATIPARERHRLGGAVARCSERWKERRTWTFPTS
jgi:hypothetical protein